MGDIEQDRPEGRGITASIEPIDLGQTDLDIKRIAPAHESTLQHWHSKEFIDWLQSNEIDHIQGDVPPYAEGGAGRAYFVDDKHVVKFTNDPMEANVAMMIKGSKDIPLVEDVLVLGGGSYAILNKRVMMGEELPKQVKDAADYMTLVIDDNPELKQGGFPADPEVREALIREALAGEREDLVVPMMHVMEALDQLYRSTGYLHDDAGPSNVGIYGGKIVFPDLGPNQTAEYSPAAAFETLNGNRSQLGLAVHNPE